MRAPRSIAWASARNTREANPNPTSSSAAWVVVPKKVRTTISSRTVAVMQAITKAAT